ncbi:MAG: MFS transporter [Clostridiales bacterium]|nr:MFS transporter [Clostridiales bacterium]
MLIAILLVLIYLAFISMGLPDSLLGSSWPAIYRQLEIPVAYAGVLSMIISVGTILSSFFSDRLIRRMGTGILTAVSVCITAVALLGFSFSGCFWKLCLWAVPLGLGAGSVDAALNNFVALHYKAKHMNWLHCFWGIGATAGPVILSFWLARGESWCMGYRAVGSVQLVLGILLLFSLPLWKKAEDEWSEEETLETTEGLECSVQEQRKEELHLRIIFSLPGVKAVLVAFFCYYAVEMTIGLWSSSYLVLCRGVSPAAAASLVSLYYVGITLGRLMAGFLSDRFSEKWMIRLGQVILAAGVLFAAFAEKELLLQVAFLVMGAGCAPIYPGLLHETPRNFGKRYCQTIMGIQMSAAYVGTTCMPPLFGILAGRSGYRIFPFYVAGLLCLMVLMIEKVNQSVAAQGNEN